MNSYMYYWNLIDCDLVYSGGGVYVAYGKIEKVVSIAKETKRIRYYFCGELNRGYALTTHLSTFRKLIGFNEPFPSGLEYMSIDDSKDLDRDILKFKSNSKNVNDDDNFDLYECERIIRNDL